MRTSAEVVGLGTVSQVLALLRSPSPNPVVMAVPAALQLIGNVHAGGGAHEVVQSEKLPQWSLHSEKLMALPKRGVRVKVCQVVRSIAPPAERIQWLLFDECLFEPLVQHCLRATDEHLRKEALWCFSGMIHHSSPTQVQTFAAEESLLSALWDGLSGDRGGTVVAIPGVPGGDAAAAAALEKLLLSSSRSDKDDDDRRATQMVSPAAGHRVTVRRKMEKSAASSRGVCVASSTHAVIGTHRRREAVSRRFRV